MLWYASSVSSYFVYCLLRRVRWRDHVIFQIVLHLLIPGFLSDMMKYVGNEEAWRELVPPKQPSKPYTTRAEVILGPRGLHDACCAVIQCVNSSILHIKIALSPYSIDSVAPQGWIRLLGLSLYR